MWHSSSICAMQFICDIIPSHVIHIWHYTSTCNSYVTLFIHAEFIRDIKHSSFICDTSIIHMCHDSFTCGMPHWHTKHCKSLWNKHDTKSQVSFAAYSLFHSALSQKRPTILRSLLIVATPYRILSHIIRPVAASRAARCIVLHHCAQRAVPLCTACCTTVHSVLHHCARWVCRYV